MFQRSVPALVVSALLVATPAFADSLAVTVRATAEAPSSNDAMPATLVEPGDVAETPEPICGVCAIVTRTKDDTDTAAIVLPSPDAFVGDVDVVVSLADGRQVTGRITGVAIDPDTRRTIALAAGDDWHWEDAQDVWTRRHRTSGVGDSQPQARWGRAVTRGARANVVGDRGVALAAAQDLGGDLTLVIVSDPDRKTGRPARATATLAGIELAAGDDLAIQIAATWGFDWDGVRAAWFELRTDVPTAAGDTQSEYRYVSIRRMP